MLNIEKIPNFVLQDIRDRGISDEEIAAMSPEEAFSEYCTWNGLLGYASYLIEALDSLRAASKPNK